MCSVLFGATLVGFVVMFRARCIRWVLEEGRWYVPPCALPSLPSESCACMPSRRTPMPLSRTFTAPAHPCALLQPFATELTSDVRLCRLRNMKESHGWGDQVTIVASDMRKWDAPEKVRCGSLRTCGLVFQQGEALRCCYWLCLQADILVSELLGSWGDNELSPECLDGVQSFLKRACSWCRVHSSLLYVPNLSVSVHSRRYQHSV